VCDDLSQLREQAFQCKQDLRAQDLNCKILKEKLSTKEVELEQRNDEVVALEHRRDWLEAEVQKLQQLLGEANQRATALEQQVFINSMFYTRCRDFALFHIQLCN
jgi:predicted nuclease with TOPRIM domain